MKTVVATPSRSRPPRVLAVCDLLEQQLCLRINALARQPGVRRLFAVVSRLGDGAFWYVLMAGCALGLGPAGRIAALQMAIAALVGVAVYGELKRRLVRERPFISHAGIVCATPPLDRYSFPSGHTLHAVLFTTLALAWFPLLALVLVPFALLVAASRVILGLHYPTDVLAGALLGWSIAQLALWLQPPLAL